jgi:hypothetical protein
MRVYAFVTEPFVPLAAAHAASLGGPIPIVTVQHPLGGIDIAAVEARAAQAVRAIVAGEGLPGGS